MHIVFNLNLKNTYRSPDYPLEYTLVVGLCRNLITAFIKMKRFLLPKPFLPASVTITLNYIHDTRLTPSSVPVVMALKFSGVGMRMAQDGDIGKGRRVLTA